MTCLTTRAAVACSQFIYLCVAVFSADKNLLRACLGSQEPPRVQGLYKKLWKYFSAILLYIENFDKMRL